MRALEAEVVDAVWAGTEPLLPPRPEHPLGCHRPRVPDRLCLWALLIRLTTGASWVDIEAILNHQVSDTTLRARRDEWIAAGVFEQLRAEALAAFDRIIGLDLTEVALDGSLHKAPYGGEGTGRNPLIVGRWAGSGRSRSTATACRSAGRSTVTTLTEISPVLLTEVPHL
jgi:transposase